MEDFSKPSVASGSSTSALDQDCEDEEEHGWKCLTDCGLFGSLLFCFMSQWIIHRR